MPDTTPPAEQPAAPLDLDAIRADLDYASGGIDGPDMPYHPYALCAMRAAEKLLAAVERAEAERDQLRYGRSLLGSARMTLDLVAAGEESRWPAARREAEDLAQRIVDEIGHPVTDEPALGPGYREQIAALTAELDQARRRITAAHEELAGLEIDEDSCTTLETTVTEVVRSWRAIADSEAEAADTITALRAERDQARRELAAAEGIEAALGESERLLREARSDALRHRVERDQAQRALAEARTTILALVADPATPAPAPEPEAPASDTADLDAAAFSVYLHGKWRYLTSQMTTDEKEALADACDRFRATWPSEDQGTSVDRWWRDDATPAAPEVPEVPEVPEHIATARAEAEQAHQQALAETPAPEAVDVEQMLHTARAGLAAALDDEERAEVLGELLAAWYQAWPDSAVTDPHQPIAQEIVRLLAPDAPYRLRDAARAWRDAARA